MAAAHDRANRFIRKAFEDLEDAKRDYLVALQHHRELDEYDRERVREWLRAVLAWELALLDGEDVDVGDAPEPPFDLD